jgi:hypothetical protein
MGVSTFGWSDVLRPGRAQCLYPPAIANSIYTILDGENKGDQNLIFTSFTKNKTTSVAGDDQPKITSFALSTQFRPPGLPNGLK